jgi:hypothetical protein
MMNELKVMDQRFTAMVADRDRVHAKLLVAQDLLQQALKAPNFTRAYKLRRLIREHLGIPEPEEKK